MAGCVLGRPSTRAFSPECAETHTLLFSRHETCSVSKTELYYNSNESEDIHAMLANVKNRLHTFWKDKSGSETIEMIGSTAVMMFLILVAVVLLSYIFEYNLVNTATKKVTRGIETTGIWNAADAREFFTAHLGSGDQLAGHEVTIDAPRMRSSRIQLKDTFKVTGKVNYTVPIIHPLGYNGFTMSFPIKSTVSGMSEVYFPRSVWGS